MISGNYELYNQSGAGPDAYRERTKPSEEIAAIGRAEASLKGSFTTLTALACRVGRAMGRTQCHVRTTSKWKGKSDVSNGQVNTLCQRDWNLKDCFGPGQPVLIHIGVLGVLRVNLTLGSSSRRSRSHGWFADDASKWVPE